MLDEEGQVPVTQQLGPQQEDTVQDQDGVGRCGSQRPGKGLVLVQVEDGFVIAQAACRTEGGQHLVL